MKKKPIIGITLDREVEKTYSEYPWYALRENYAQAVAKFAAVPLMLPYFKDCISEYISMIDGLILAGGFFDIPPSLYGEKINSDTVLTRDIRTDFEIALCNEAIKAHKPILGICAGEQLINVILGGTLIQHIPDEIENALDHEQKTPKHLTSHRVDVVKGTLLHKIVECDEFEVNSTHHQAVKAVGDRVLVNAKAPDGVIEGIESQDHPFCLGVEWHPEYLTTEQDHRIIKYFIEKTIV